MSTPRDAAIQAALAEFALPSGVHIRAWNDADYPAVRDLARAEGWTTLHTRPEDGMRAWQHSWPALVAVHAGAVIGFVRAMTDEAVTMYIADLLVAPAWRGQQIGTALLHMCHLLFPTTRLDLLSLESAQHFYQAQGFVPFRGFRKSSM